MQYSFNQYIIALCPEQPASPWLKYKNPRQAAWGYVNFNPGKANVSTPSFLGEEMSKVSIELSKELVEVQQVIGIHWLKLAELSLLRFSKVCNQLRQLPLLNHRSHQTLTATGGAKNAKEPKVIPVTEDPYISPLIELTADTTLYIGNQSFD